MQHCDGPLEAGMRHSFFEILNSKGFSLFFANFSKTPIILKRLLRMTQYFPWKIHD